MKLRMETPGQADQLKRAENGADLLVRFDLKQHRRAQQEAEKAREKEKLRKKEVRKKERRCDAHCRTNRGSNCRVANRDSNGRVVGWARTQRPTHLRISTQDAIMTAPVRVRDAHELTHARARAHCKRQERERAKRLQVSTFIVIRTADGID
jgi:hypothetical protein